jgi:hypothetical protein
MAYAGRCKSAARIAAIARWYMTIGPGLSVADGMGAGEAASRAEINAAAIVMGMIRECVP